MFTQLLSLIRRMAPEEIDRYIDLSVQQEAVEITTRLLEYKNKLYPPEKLEQIQEIAFEKEMGMREMTLLDYRKIFSIKKEDGIYIITKYKAENPSVVIPAHIKGISVQFLNQVFLYNKTIQSVYIEDGITTIGDSTFHGCVNLQSITIPDSVTSIGIEAFKYCRNLQNLSIPDSVTKIGNEAFHGCDNLIIHATAGSYAETYAKENRIKFQTI